MPRTIAGVVAFGLLLLSASGIANNFFGWGLMLRLADPEGVHLAAE